MHHLLHHHIITHVIAPLVISTGIAIAIAASNPDNRGNHPAVISTKVHAPTRKGQ